MAQDPLTLNVRMRSIAFGALAAAALGLGLVETGCLLVQARPLIHVFNILFGAVLISLLLRRFLLSWPPGGRPPQRAEGTGSADKTALIRTASCVSIAGAAYLATATLVHGFISLFMLFACGLVFLQWNNIARTRLQCLACFLASAIGMGVALLASGGRIHPLLLAAATWSLWTSAIAAWWRLVISERMKRQAAPGVEAVAGIRS